jgi:hypothetical protein
MRFAEEVIDIAAGQLLDGLFAQFSSDGLEHVLIAGCGGGLDLVSGQ